VNSIPQESAKLPTLKPNQINLMAQLDVISGCFDVQHWISEKWQLKSEIMARIIKPVNKNHV
jgi:hypothetical protein